VIGSLRGRLSAKTTEQLLIDVGGVGYVVYVPLSTFTELPETGVNIELLTHTHVREDALVLYGFITELELQVFRLLITVSGVGPRLALNLLSGLSAPEVVRAVIEGAPSPIVAVPGVGKKTADRLIVDLRDRMMKLDTTLAGIAAPVPVAEAGDPDRADALSALTNLGYRTLQAERALDDARKELPEAPIEKLLRECLKRLSGLT
jgi:Holliday junction DNA helicase RuvA